jgi:hypothetical protein
MTTIPFNARKALTRDQNVRLYPSIHTMYKQANTIVTCARKNWKYRKWGNPKNNSGVTIAMNAPDILAKKLISKIL